MAKINNGLNFKLIHLIIILLTLFGSGIAAWVWQQAETKAVTKDVKTMDTDGCKPAMQNKLDIALMQMSMSNIQKDQAEIKVEQKAIRKELQVGLQEILRRLPNNE